jgi:hypothetical protein
MRLAKRQRSATRQRRHIEKIEPDSGMMQSVGEHQEAPEEDATVMPVGEPRKRRRDRNLDARRRRKQQERTQKKDGCRKNLVAARRGTTHRAAVAWRKINVFRKILTHRYCGLRKEVTAVGMKITRCAGHRHKGQNKDIVEQEIPKRQTEENKSWKVPECENGIMDRGLRQQPRLEIMRINNEVFGRTTRLGIAK